MITTIDQTTLEKYLPFTKDVKGSRIFAAYSKPLEDADFVLKRDLLSSELYSYLKTAFAATNLPSNEALTDNEYRIGGSLADIKDAILKYICNKAAYLSAGKNDLVQTTFGFGTVSGQQEAIASAARVEAMKADCRRAFEQAEDDLIKMLVGNDYTEQKARSSYAWKNKTRYLVWTREEMLEIFPVDGEVEPIARHQGDLGPAHEALANIISHEQLDALVGKMRLCTVNAGEQRLIDQCRNLLSAMIHKNVNDIERRTIDIYVTLEKYSFPEWLASDERKARKIGPLENTKDSGAFFMI